MDKIMFYITTNLILWKSVILYEFFANNEIFMEKYISMSVILKQSFKNLGESNKIFFLSL